MLAAVQAALGSAQAHEDAKFGAEPAAQAVQTRLLPAPVAKKPELQIHELWPVRDAVELPVGHEAHDVMVPATAL